MKSLNSTLLYENLKKQMQKSINDNIILGGICQVNQEGRCIARVTLGKLRFDSDMTPQGNDLFRLASMTKNICGITTLQLIEQGKLTLDTQVSDFFPGFKDKWIGKIGEDGSIEKIIKSRIPITVRHLVTHTSGLLGSPQEDFKNISSEITLKSVTDYYEHESLLMFEPGTKWIYSPVAGCDLLSRLVELLSDMPYQEYVKKYITDPLEMPDTTFLPSKEQWTRMASVMAWDSNGNPCEHVQSQHSIFAGIPSTYHSGGACLASTLDDYMKVSDALCAEGRAYNGYRLLHKESVALMGSPLTPQGMVGMFTRDTCFGVLTRVYKNHPWMPDGCFGWNGYYGAQTWVDPKNKISAIYLKNGIIEAETRLQSGDMSDENCPDRHFEKAVYNSMSF